MCLRGDYAEHVQQDCRHHCFCGPGTGNMKLWRGQKGQLDAESRCYRKGRDLWVVAVTWSYSKSLSLSISYSLGQAVRSWTHSPPDSVLPRHQQARHVKLQYQTLGAGSSAGDQSPILSSASLFAGRHTPSSLQTWWFACYDSSFRRKSLVKVRGRKFVGFGHNTGSLLALCINACWARQRTVTGNQLLERCPGHTI